MTGRIDTCKKIVASVLIAGLAPACGPKPGGATEPASRAAPETAAATVDPEVGERRRAKDAFYAAVAGGKSAESSRLLWKAIFDGDPQDREATAYCGASTVLAAAGARWPWEKGRLAREGMALLDRAVTSAPDDLEARFLRGMTNYRLPRFLGRFDLAADDLAFVAGRARPAAEAGLLDRPLAAAALYHYGRVCEERGDRAAAAAACRAATEVGPDTPSGRAAARWLGQSEQPG